MESFPCLVQFLHPGLVIFLLLLGTVIPEDAVAFLTALRILKALVDHFGFLLAPWVDLPNDLQPSHIVVAHPVEKTRMLCPRSGHHRQEPPIAFGDQIHDVISAEFAVGHIQEIGATDDLTQSPPGLFVDLAVPRVPVVDLAMDGHGAVRSYRAVVEKLFEIRAVVFVVASSDTSRAIGVLGWHLCSILPREGDGGRVLVHLLKGELKAANGAKGNGSKQAGAIRAKQVIKGTTKAVVVEQRELFGKKPEVFGDEAGNPSSDAVQGLPSEQEIAEQDTQDGGGWHMPLASAPTRQETVEQTRQVESRQEVADHRRAADLQRFMAKRSRQR